MAPGIGDVVAFGKQLSKDKNVSKATRDIAKKSLALVACVELSLASVWSGRLQAACHSVIAHGRAFSDCPGASAVDAATLVAAVAVLCPERQRGELLDKAQKMLDLDGVFESKLREGANKSNHGRGGRGGCSRRRRRLEAPHVHRRPERARGRQEAEAHVRQDTAPAPVWSRAFIFVVGPMLPGRLGHRATRGWRVRGHHRERVGRRAARGSREVPRRRRRRAPRAMGRCARGGDEHHARQVLTRGNRAVVSGDANGGAHRDASAGRRRGAVEEGAATGAVQVVAPRSGRSGVQASGRLRSRVQKRGFAPTAAGEVGEKTRRLCPPSRRLERTCRRCSRCVRSRRRRCGARGVPRRLRR